MFGKLSVGVLFSLWVTNLAWAEPPRTIETEVPTSVLQAMGLGELQPLTKQQGAQVRGKFTFAFSKSFAAGVWTASSNPPPSTSNPAFVRSWAVGVSPGVVTFSKGSAFAFGY